MMPSPRNGRGVGSRGRLREGPETVKREHDKARRRRGDCKTPGMTGRLKSLAVGSGGFTLAELLIAIGILGVGLTMSAALFPAGLKANKGTADDLKGTIVCKNGLAIARRVLRQSDIPTDGSMVDRTNVIKTACSEDVQYAGDAGVGYFVLARQVKADTNDYQLVVIAYRKHPGAGDVTLKMVTGQQDGQAAEKFLFTAGDMSSVQVDSAVLICGGPAAGGNDEDPQIIDYGMAGYNASQGTWTKGSRAGYGYNNNYHWARNGNPSPLATWTFSGLSPGKYRVYATWPEYPGCWTSVPFSVQVGGSTVWSGRINQQQRPGPLFTDGEYWSQFGNGFDVFNGQISVSLTNDSSSTQYVVSDAVRIEMIPGSGGGGGTNAAVGKYAMIDSLNGNSATLDRSMASTDVVSAFVIHQADVPASAAMAIMSVRTTLRE